MKINKKIFDNGLRLVHNEDTSTQMVALNIVYDVGARDEHPEHTGFAHLFEHLMFGGSVHIPDYDAPLQLAGGENNAWTNNDITNYYLTVPKSNVEIGFWLESDRMLELAFSEQSLEVQRATLLAQGKFITINELSELKEPASAIIGIPLRNEEAEKRQIIEALRQTGNNKSRAAQLLGIDRKTLYNKLKLYNISD